MERISEVEELVEVLADGLRQGDVGAVLETMSPDVTMICGTDEREWWTGYDAVARAVREQLEASGGLDITTGSPRAFGDGGLSVFDDSLVLKTPDGQSFTTRLTGAARFEDGKWRIVQHTSRWAPRTRTWECQTCRSEDPRRPGQSLCSTGPVSWWSDWAPLRVRGGGSLTRRCPLAPSGTWVRGPTSQRRECASSAPVVRVDPTDAQGVFARAAGVRRFAYNPAVARITPTTPNGPRSATPRWTRPAGCVQRHGYRPGAAGRPAVWTGTAGCPQTGVRLRQATRPLPGVLT
jgi:ketosteroid isomerase-like protein